MLVKTAIIKDSADNIDNTVDTDRKVIVNDVSICKKVSDEQNKSITATHRLLHRTNNNVSKKKNNTLIILSIHYTPFNSLLFCGRFKQNSRDTLQH